MDPAIKIAADAATASNQLIQLGAIGAMCFLQFVGMAWLVIKSMPAMQAQFHIELQKERDANAAQVKEDRKEFLVSLAEERETRRHGNRDIQQEIKELAGYIRELINTISPPPAPLPPRRAGS